MNRAGSKMSTNYLFVYVLCAIVIFFFFWWQKIEVVEVTHLVYILCFAKMGFGRCDI